MAKGLLTVILATAWVLGVIRYMGTRRHPRETPDHIDRDFRELVDRAQRSGGGCAFVTSGGINRTARKCRLEARHDGPHDMLGLIRECPDYGPNCRATAWRTPHDGPTDGCNCRIIPHPWAEEGINGKSTH